MNKISFNDRIERRFIIGITIILSLLFLWMIKAYIMPVILAAITAGLTYKLYQFLCSKLKKQGIAAAITVIAVLLIFIIPLGLFTTLVVDQAASISKDVVPFLEKELNEKQATGFQVPDWVPFKEQLNISSDSIVEKANELSGKIGNIIVNSLTSVTQGTFMFFLQLFIYLYALYFFLIDGKKYIQQSKQYIPLSNDDFNSMLEQFTSVTRATLKGALLIGILQGTLIGLALWILGVKGAAFWGAISIVLSLIPSIGSGFVWVPIAIWMFTQGDTAQAIGLVIWGAIIVGSIDNVLRPKLVGNDAKMSDLIILLSTLGGLGLFGVVGFIVGPLVAGLVITSWKIYNEKLIIADEDENTRYV